MIETKRTTKKYLECDRCKMNNWDKSEFWGCSSDNCDVETKGIIAFKTTLIKHEE